MNSLIFCLQLFYISSLASNSPTDSKDEIQKRSVDQIKREKHNFFVPVQVNKEINCGGTVLINKEILTATSCLYDASTKKWVDAGDTVVFSHFGKIHENRIRQRCIVDSDKHFGGFYSRSKDYNTAILTMRPKFVFDPHLKPIQQCNSSTLGKMSKHSRRTVAALFAKVPNGQNTVNFTAIEVTEVEPRTSQDKYNNLSTDGVFCHNNETSSFCHGFVGGPLLLAGLKGTPKCVYGIVNQTSYNKSVCRKEHMPRTAGGISDYLPRFTNDTAGVVNNTKNTSFEEEIAFNAKCRHTFTLLNLLVLLPLWCYYLKWI